MRVRLLTSYVFCIMSFVAWSQSPESSLDQLKAPSMPAANIISSQVNEVNRPKTLKDFEVAILNNFLDSAANVVIPNNYALEGNIYMLSKRRNFNYKNYIKGEKFGETWWQDFSVSIASTTQFKINDSISSNALGIGLRTNLLRGKLGSDFKNRFKLAQENNERTLEIKGILKFIPDLYPNGEPFTPDNMEKLFLKVIDTTNVFSQKEKDLLITFINGYFQENTEDSDKDQFEYNFIEAYDAQFSQLILDEMKEQIENISTERYGWKMDINYAQAINFPENNWDNVTTSKAGAWLNLSYRPGQTSKLDANDKDPSNFEFIFMSRFIYLNEEFVNQYKPQDVGFKVGANIDFGLRLIYELQSFSLEAEYVQRFNRRRETIVVAGEEYFRWEDANANKFVLNINYHPNKDLVLSYNIGKNYNSTFDGGQDLISGITINKSFGGY